MLQINRFDLEQLKKVSLTDFFHPEFLARCGFIERSRGRETNKWYLLRTAIFLRNEAVACALDTLWREVWVEFNRTQYPHTQTPENHKERERLLVLWDGELKKFLDEQAIKNVGELVCCPSAQGLRQRYSYDPSAGFRPIGITSFNNINAALQYFGFEKLTPRAEHHKLESEFESARIAAEIVLRNPK